LVEIKGKFFAGFFVLFMADPLLLLLGRVG
jgi:hypothetical protein